MDLCFTSQLRATIAKFAFLLTTFVAACSPKPVAAQLMSDGGSKDPAGGRPGSTQIDFFTLVESAGDAFLGMFESQDRASVDNPEWNSTESPRHTVMTFIEAMDHVAQGRDEALARALSTFGDVKVDRKEQVAQQLLQVFDRLPEVSPGTIPGPNVVEKNDIRRWELFPRGIDRDWLYRAVSEPPDGAIVIEEKDGEWYFAKSTLDGAEDLAKSMLGVPPQPRREQRGRLFMSVIEPTLDQTSVLDVVVAIAIVATGIGAAWLLYRLLSSIRKSRKLQGDGFILPLLNGALVSAMILAVAIGFALGSTRLHLHPVLSDLRWSMIEIAVVLAGAWLAVSLLELACLGVRRSVFGKEDPYANMMALVLRRSLRIIAGIILTLFVFQNIFMWNITAMLGGFGIIALALSLAAKDAVKNLFGAVTIFANRPFINGDWVKYSGEIGQVEDVSVQMTRIRLLSGEVLAVPNMKFIDDAVENLSMRKYLRRTMRIALPYGTPPEKIEQAIVIVKEVLTSEEVVQNGQCDLDEHPPKVWFTDFGEYSLGLRADYWYMIDSEHDTIQRDSERGWFSYLDHATIVNQAIVERFDESGIDFAFPTQTINLENADGVLT